MGYVVLANRIETIVGHKRSTGLAAQRRRIDAIYRGLSQTVITAPTKDRIESAVCDELAAFEGYTLVWIGGFNPNRENAIEFRVQDGADIETMELVAPDESHDQLPEMAAIDTESVRVVDDVTEAGIERIHPLTDELDFQSVITVPITGAGIPYGGLTIYSDVAGTFSGPEGQMLADLGDLIGFAFVAAEQRRGMFSYTVREVELSVTDPSADLIEVAETLGTTVRLEGAVPRPDGQAVLFLRLGTDGSNPDQTAETLNSIFASIESRTVNMGDDTTLWSVVDSSWFGEQFAHHGVQLTEVSATPDHARFVLECPPSIDTRDLVELARFHYSEVTVTAQRHRSHDEIPSSGYSMALADLTERQQDVLETAYRNDFFAWPRETTAEEVATILDISQPAFSRHIRRSEQKVFSRLFDGDPDGD